MDKILCEIKFRFKERIILAKFWEFRFRFVEFDVDGKSFGRGDEGREDRDVADFFSFERAAVLEFSAFGVMGVRFRDRSIINGKDAIRGGSGGSLFLNEADSDVVEFFSDPNETQRRSTEIFDHRCWRPQPWRIGSFV